jgi:hypothetical protein
MIFTFKSGNIPICRIDITVSEKEGVKFKRILTKPQHINKDSLPFAVQGCQMSHLNTELEHWFKKRMIPADREGLKELTENLLNAKIKHPYETIQILSLCSYGASMTDSFWLSNPQDYTLKLPGHPLDGFVIKAHPKRSGLVKVESPLFKNCVLGKTNTSPDSRYICQDFAMGGKKQKYISCKEDKYYVNKLCDNYADYINTAIACMKEYPDYVSSMKFVKDDDGNRIGYAVRIQTSDLFSFVSLEDLCLCVHNPKVNWDSVDEAFEKFNLSKSCLDDLKDIQRKYYNTELYPDKNAFFKKAGLIYNNRDKTIHKPIVWF